MVGLKETENDDFIADSVAVKKVKRVNFHFSCPHNFFDHDPKKFYQFSLFTFFTFSLLSAAPRWTSPEHINFWSKKKSEKSEKSEK